MSLSLVGWASTGAISFSVVIALAADNLDIEKIDPDKNYRGINNYTEYLNAHRFK